MNKLDNIASKSNGISDTVKSNRRNNHVVFIICVLIASFFWLLIKLSDEYNESYDIKVKYRNIPKEKLLTSIIDTNVTINLRAQGFQMLKLVLTADLGDLSIDLNRYDIMNLNKNIYYISTYRAKERMATEIGIPIEQIEISSERLKFVLEDLTEKSLEVVSNIKFGFDASYNLYSKTNLEPSSIKVYGPADIMDTLEYIQTENRTIPNISDNIDIEINLLNPYPEQIRFSIDKVKIKAKVEKFTESSLETQVDLSDINHNIKAFPSTVKVFFTVAQKDFSQIRPSQFKVKANLKNIDIRSTKKLQLEVVEKPGLASGIRIQPSEIEFLIIK